ncbi:hypothetical protein CIPAW_09G128400 [Carya illinoinensis]|uniref:Reverse transcriptase domain-containing protein n=1 Tax=Carya illinoinensis TaxID=32201 RepID=A0A8T1PPH8_CARIL|nr:hypothetical protein CIPAW_09G128400 [Carya illinoinensis]
MVSVKAQRVMKRESLGKSQRNIPFADDTLFFCEADPSQVRVLKVLLLCFKATSGLKLNLEKSEMVPIGGVRCIRQLASILGCKIAALPMTYGLPLRAASRAAPLLDLVIEKVELHLVGWKRMYLSKGGRITLIKNRNTPMEGPNHMAYTTK